VWKGFRNACVAPSETARLASRAVARSGIQRLLPYRYRHLIRGKAAAFREKLLIFSAKVCSRPGFKIINLSHCEIIYRILKNE
jgi:hypothetical protein